MFVADVRGSVVFLVDLCGTGSFFTFAGFGGGGGVLVNLPDAILCSGVRSAVWFGTVVFPVGRGF